MSKKKIHPFIEKIVSLIEHNYFIDLAFDMKTFKYFVSDRTFKIIESWFFLHYIRLANITNVEDQKEEAIQNLISYITDISLKYYNMDRRKAIEDVIIGWDEYDRNKDNRLEWICETGIDYYTYNKNKLNIDKSIIKQCVIDWLKYGLNDIIDKLVNRDYSYNELKNYVIGI